MIALGFGIGAHAEQAPVQASATDALIQRMIASYDAVETLSVDARKDIHAGEDRIRMLSRVWFARPDRLRVENSEPVERLLLADGQNFHVTVAAHHRGLRQPISDLDWVRLAALRTVPGTAMEDLWRLIELPEIELPPTDEWPLRRGYDADRHFVVLSMDAQNRLRRLDSYESAEMKSHRGEIIYDNFVEAVPGGWIPRLHRSRILDGEIEIREIRRFSNLEVNGTIAPERFDAGLLKNISEWVDETEAFLAP